MRQTCKHLNPYLTRTLGVNEQRKIGCPSVIECSYHRATSRLLRTSWATAQTQLPILRCLVKQLEKGDVNVVDLKKNIEYAASVLEAVYIDETRKLLDTEDELSDIQTDSVPSEVRDWLASTFTRKMGLMKKKTEEKPKFRSIVHAVQAGIFVERSDVAILYNDRSVLENHHVSAAYRLMQEEEMNIFVNLSKDDWRIDRAKTMSLILHAADISHPAKTWELHYRWTMALMEEFFRQGDKEAELGLPFSPLCDRKSTMVAQSQIGFIDFIVEPTFSLLTDTTEKIVIPLIEESAKSESSNYRPSSTFHVADSLRRSNVKCPMSDGSYTPDYSLSAVDLKSFKNNLVDIIQQNKERWKELATQGDAMFTKAIGKFQRSRHHLLIPHILAHIQILDHPTTG
ncbi:hypothetical protein NN561_009226 [Cricetulus griseus]